MIAEYTVHFHEPLQGVLMDGRFSRYVDDEDEAVRYQVYFEMKYKELYDDKSATVGLVSVR